MITTIILALLFGLILIVGAAYLSFNGRINREISGLLAGANGGGRVVVTEEMIRNLPAPVQKYMIYSGVAGKAIPRMVRLKQTGRIRQAAKSAWMEARGRGVLLDESTGFRLESLFAGQEISRDPGAGCLSRWPGQHAHQNGITHSAREGGRT